jgi:hypothetical protein
LAQWRTFVKETRLAEILILTGKAQRQMGGGIAAHPPYALSHSPGVSGRAPAMLGVFDPVTEGDLGFVYRYEGQRL